MDDTVKVNTGRGTRETVVEKSMTTIRLGQIHPEWRNRTHCEIDGARMISRGTVEFRMGSHWWPTQGKPARVADHAGQKRNSPSHRAPE